MLRQVNDLAPQQAPLIPIRLIQVNSHELVADLRRKLAIVHLTVGRIGLEDVKLVTPLSQLLLIVILSVVLLALVLGPLLPSILIEAVAKHEDELHDLPVVSVVDHLAAVAQVQDKDLVGRQHVALRL